jgi:hypothetical protein
MVTKAEILKNELSQQLVAIEEKMTGPMRLKAALAMNCSEQTIRNYLGINSQLTDLDFAERLIFVCNELIEKEVETVA